MTTMIPMDLTTIHSDHNYLNDDHRAPDGLDDNHNAPEGLDDDNGESERLDDYHDEPKGLGDDHDDLSPQWCSSVLFHRSQSVKVGSFKAYQS